MKKQEEYIYIKNIKCTILHQKIKNTYIQIKDENVIVKVPMKASNEYIKDVLEKKEKWIITKLELQSKQNKLQYEEEDIVYVLGKPYTLKIIYTDTKRDNLYLENKKICCNLNTFERENSKDVVKKLIDKYYRYIATQEVPSVMEDIEERTGLAPKEVNIKNLKATWGICSSNKIISINQNLMAYSKHAIEYVCLHEVCHLKYMNHSKDFWNMVEYYMPDYKTAKDELKYRK